MPQLLFGSASSGTGSEVSFGENIAADVLVYVPSGAFAAQGVQLWARLTGHSSSYTALRGTALTASVAQQVITGEGLYLYSNVGGTSITTRVEKSGSAEVSIMANTILKR